MGISADDVSNIFRAENPQLLAIFCHLGSSIFLIIIRQCRDCRTAGQGSRQSEKSSYIEVFRRIQVPPKMESNSGASSGSAGNQFYISGSSNKKFYPQTVTDVRPGVRVTVREKRSYLAFSSTSGFGEVLPRILGDPPIR